MSPFQQFIFYGFDLKPINLSDRGSIEAPCGVDIW